MTVTKKDDRVRVSLRSSTREILDEIVAEEGLTQSEAMNKVLEEYDAFKQQKFDLATIAASLQQTLLQEMRAAIKEEVSEEMKRIRLGTNNADRNTQVLLELLTAKIQSDLDESGILVFSNLQTPDFLIEAKSVVNERIMKQIQKKYS